ncbi:helix-turn-helix domain-containing protein [Arcobacter cryaerophilus gv. pseudocryaerophilus]|uniref:Helix-turn-helix domain-containing protein n=3 Tax=unclassified Arcobacter TaxID=2593671 RepID=A0AA96L0S1_9BACT|nr:helix-turn-helix domain-containing protein [Arcobacter sp. AZ-2023]WPD04839.1 helix-turn-helix domain-containing protein [Arcobacter sp. DSM 115956]WPD06934.1 helix-turn-helix domain-containing protein [Arcobacter sp. DSM 115955]WNL31199.1 helix-turn-helix domain-containing protein [Arcobacter sp. AZ-2023]WNP37349.1 helix-turn-helix domain-containing protein [Arcobacter sp. AZ-2023]
MSIKLTAKAWETNQSGNDLLVLLALCDFSNDEGVSFPSLKTLSSKAKVGKSTLAYILKAYEDIGVITRERRTRDNKSNTSTLYKINHLDIDANEYQKAYQKARNYTAANEETPHCGQGINDTNVDKGSHIVDKGSANCGQLEPSSINHQDINQEKRENNSKLTNAKKETAPLSFSKNENIESEINPKEIIEAYRNQISNKHSDIQEPTSFNAIAQHSNEFKQILTGIENYAKYLKQSNKKPEKLFFFIRNKIYLDYQVETVEQQDINPGIKSSGPYQSKADRTKNFMNNYYARKAKALESDNQIIDVEVIS